MKNYKDYEKINLGFSDIAQLVIRDSEKIGFLEFGGDGDYTAYLVDGDAEIGEHYTPVYERKDGWVWIYDDERRVFQARGNSIKIYRAGEFGCIIQVIGEA